MNSCTGPSGGKDVIDVGDSELVVTSPTYSVN